MSELQFVDTQGQVSDNRIMLIWRVQISDFSISPTFDVYDYDGNLVGSNVSVPFYFTPSSSATMYAVVAHYDGGIYYSPWIDIGSVPGGTEKITFSSGINIYMDGDSVVVEWGEATSSNGSTVTYKLVFSGPSNGTIPTSGTSVIFDSLRDGTYLFEVTASTSGASETISKSFLYDSGSGYRIWYYDNAWHECNIHVWTGEKWEECVPHLWDTEWK